MDLKETFVNCSDFFFFGESCGQRKERRREEKREGGRKEKVPTVGFTPQMSVIARAKMGDRNSFEPFLLLPGPPLAGQVLDN